MPQSERAANLALVAREGEVIGGLRRGQCAADRCLFIIVVGMSSDGRPALYVSYEGSPDSDLRLTSAPKIQPKSVVEMFALPSSRDDRFNLTYSTQFDVAKADVDLSRADVCQTSPSCCCCLLLILIISTEKQSERVEPNYYAIAIKQHSPLHAFRIRNGTECYWRCAGVDAVTDAVSFVIVICTLLLGEVQPRKQHLPPRTNATRKL